MLLVGADVERTFGEDDLPASGIISEALVVVGRAGWLVVEEEILCREILAGGTRRHG